MPRHYIPHFSPAARTHFPIYVRRHEGTRLCFPLVIAAKSEGRFAASYHVRIERF